MSLNFDTYEELARFPDCKYAVDTGEWVRNLCDRMESLNLVGDMLWLDPVPKSFKQMPITRYEWLTISTDVFLVRYVSVIDCALLLVNQVCQAGLTRRACTIDKIAKAGITPAIVEQLKIMMDEQEQIRIERNARIHHGIERRFTDDDQTFKTASLFADRYHGIRGKDMFDRKIDVDLSFREGLVGMQRDFNLHVRKLEHQLDNLYHLLWDEFEDRFGPLIAAATHGLNAGARK
ncbi:hypothetical protein thsrh120_59470 [Rhizobium sp. No.120]